MVGQYNTVRKPRHFLLQITMFSVNHIRSCNPLLFMVSRFSTTPAQIKNGVRQIVTFAGTFFLYANQTRENHCSRDQPFVVILASL